MPDVGTADVDAADYLTESNLRLLLTGVGSGALACLAATVLRRPPMWIAGAVAPAVALFASGWWGWTDPPTERTVLFLVVGLAAGHGYERLPPTPAVLRPLALLAALAGIWLGVPENDPALVVAGAVAGLAVARRPGPGAGYGPCVAAAWTVVLGSLPTGPSFPGGLACLGPLAAFGALAALDRPVSRLLPRRLPAWPWFLVGSGAVALAAARWIAVAPAPGAARVVAVAAAALAVAALTRP